MGKLSLALAIIVFVALIGGGLFLAFSDIPAPSQRVEKVLPDARFPK